MGSHGDPNKWRRPGWRIEQRYGNNVLIGNWQEERHKKFERQEVLHNSTNRIDFQDFGQSKPDVTVRRNAQRRNDGLGKELIFYHHGKKYCNNLISWYDEQYNGRERNPPFPAQRNWDSHKMSWAPERSDHPLEGAPTNFGLFAEYKRGWEKQKANETHGDFDTTYGTDFLKHDVNVNPVTRFAIPKDKSSSVHPSNRIIHNLDLRGRPILQQPEIYPTVPSAAL